MNFSKDTLQEGLNRFKNKKVLVVGDVMLDAYWWGSVDRISPEAPVPVVHVKEQENRLGGAANVALNLKHLQARPSICAVTGNDQEAELFAALLEKEGIDGRYIVRSEDRPTTVKTRILGNRSHLLRVDKENGNALSDELRQKVTVEVLKGLEDASALIFQDYDKGLLEPAMIRTIIDEARKRNVPVIVDPKKKNFLAYNGVTLFKPNLKEMLDGLKIDLPATIGSDFYKASTEQLMKTLNPEILMLTLSEKGMWLLNADGKHHHIKAHYRDITDVSGAGDTVLAVATLAYLSGMPAEEMGWIANLAGGMVCERVGVVPVEWENLNDEINKHT